MQFASFAATYDWILGQLFSLPTVATHEYVGSMIDVAKAKPSFYVEEGLLDERDYR